MRKEDKINVDEFLKYVLKSAKESYLENPFPTYKEKNELVNDAAKKLDVVARAMKGEHTE